MDNILALIGRAHQGDKRARDILTEKNMGLVHSIAARFKNRGVEMEDLVQIGCIGLLKAIDKFDLSYDVKFSTYAVPMITGEIKRFLRDDGMVKVSRSLKEMAAKAYALRETIYQSDGNEISLGERLPQEENQQEKVVNRMFLEQALNMLDKKERELIYLRFFQDRTQSSIAGELGMSQVQVSRMEKKILKRLREKL